MPSPFGSLPIISLAKVLKKTLFESVGILLAYILSKETELGVKILP